MKPEIESNADFNALSSYGSHLLVVDDEESVALTVSEVLRLDGYEVHTALSGGEAIARLQNNCYDLVLTDLHMEGGDGISVLSEVRRCSPLTIAIVLTGFASLESAIAAMRQGAYDYLVKPCIIDDMKHTIQRGLEHRRLMLAEQEARQNLELLNRELERRVEQRTVELKRVNEELANANNAKDVFFATLSHELRTPLTPILGWAKLLKSSNADESLLNQGLDAIERNARLQTRLIDDLLDISRIVSGKLHFEVEPTNMCAVVEAAIETVRDKATQRGVEMKVRMTDATLIVHGSPVRLQQIAWNLLSNAIKFTDRGGVVSIEVDQSDGEARVVVTDTGSGISPDFLPQVFDLFRQADGSTTRQHGGLGLGLAIVRRLVDLHGGWVRAESEGLGRGARFSFGIPLAVDKKNEREAEAAALVFNVPQPILIVEDSPDTLEMMRAFFVQKGCRVLVAKSVEEALNLAAAEKPRIIISDIGMPDADGYELLAGLRRLPEMENVPAIAFSGYAMEEDYARALEAGFSAHIAKPLDPEKLLLIIQKLNP
ncbi:MAG TPA: response regulator [Blastocatellia bacterium]|jgi:signal transduction histidine kinase|nr:response regulator [Blastocatellia bacterium]